MGSFGERGGGVKASERRARRRAMELRLARILQEIRAQPPEVQESFKWMMFTGLADRGWLEFCGVRESEVGKVYLFREPMSGEMLAALRPEISPETEEELRGQMQNILGEEVSPGWGEKREDAE